MVLNYQNEDPTIAFVVMGLCAIPITLYLLSLASPKKQTENKKFDLSYGLPEYLIVFLTSLFLFLYIGMEVVGSLFEFRFSSDSQP